jgi:hypothetical protein
VGTNDILECKSLSKNAHRTAKTGLPMIKPPSPDAAPSVLPYKNDGYHLSAKWTPNRHAIRPHVISAVTECMVAPVRNGTPNRHAIRPHVCWLQPRCCSSLSISQHPPATQTDALELQPRRGIESHPRMKSPLQKRTNTVPEPNSSVLVVWGGFAARGGRAPYRSETVQFWLLGGLCC